MSEGAVALMLTGGVSVGCAWASYRMLRVTARHYRQTRTFLRRSARVVGRVTRIECQEGARREDTLHYSVIEFRPPDGPSSWFRVGGSYVPRHRVGDAVRVRYDRQDPSNAFEDTVLGLWTNVLLTGSFGVALAGAAVGSLLLVIGVL